MWTLGLGIIGKAVGRTEKFRVVERDFIFISGFLMDKNVAYPEPLERGKGRNVKVLKIFNLITQVYYVAEVATEIILRNIFNVMWRTINKKCGFSKTLKSLEGLNKNL